jgi:hypothetical protein
MNTPGVHYPHRIRLRGPWQSEPLGDAVRRRRRFGYPGRIDADERVWLTFSGVGGRAVVSVNGQTLGSHEGPQPFEYEVTPLLAARNQLVMEIMDGDSSGDVALEVRRTAFLSGVRATADGERLRVSGTVAGSAERALELYVLFDGHTVHYSTVSAGAAFDVVAEGVGQLVRVELVDGASVWYVVELPLAA